MIAPWLVAVFVSVILNVAAVIIAPKPKGPKPDAVEQGQNPTASAGKAIGVVFGTITVQEPNVLWFGDKSAVEYQVKV